MVTMKEGSGGTVGSTDTAKSAEKPFSGVNLGENVHQSPSKALGIGHTKDRKNPLKSTT